MFYFVLLCFNGGSYKIRNLLRSQGIKESGQLDQVIQTGTYIHISKKLTTSPEDALEGNTKMLTFIEEMQKSESKVSTFPGIWTGSLMD